MSWVDAIEWASRLDARNKHPRGTEFYIPRTAPAVGIMLHYDGSAGADKWALGWFLDPRCEVGYDVEVTDDGGAHLVHGDPIRHSSRHAGPCLPEPHIPQGNLKLPGGGLLRYGRANGAYYGVAVTTGPRAPVTPLQAAKVAAICAAMIMDHWDRWVGGPNSVPDLNRLIVSHAAKAIYTPAYTSNAALWGSVGRKDDPEGPPADVARGIVVMSTESVRIATAMLLTPPPAVSPHPAMIRPDQDPWGFFSTSRARPFIPPTQG